jgi:RNA polymerase sigma-70 factor (ECF subfamily)
VVQDAYFRALTNLDQLKDPNAFRSWLAGIVVRRVQTRLRHRALLNRIGLRARVETDPDLALSDGCPPDVAAELARIYGTLDALSTQARMVLVLRRVEGHSLVEIAQLLGSSLSTVKRRLGEAERALELQQREP